METISLEAPGKLNLGLEVIGRRDEGYHDIVTIFQAISLVDTITLGPAPSLRLTTNASDVANDENLVLRALRELQTVTGVTTGAAIELTKRIPIAAGLGGASSDAAAAMRAAGRLWGLDINSVRLHTIAASIGSDVAFFLRGGTALGTGRGNVLKPLPQPRVWFVVVSPRLTIPRKTATLYAALTAADFSNGDRVRQLVRRLQAGNPLDPVLLGNAFARPLLEIAPALRDLHRQMLDAGAPFVALSGAGPSHYTVATNPADAQTLMRALRSRLGTTTDIFVCQPLSPNGLLPD